MPDMTASTMMFREQVGERQVSQRLISLQGLRKTFGKKTVLDHIDLDIAAQRATVLIGPSSSGKSVLVKCMLGLMEADYGEVLMEGESLSRLSREETERLHDRIGVVFQQNALFDSLPIWENVAFRLLSRGRVSRTQAREIAQEKLGLFGLKPWVGDRYPAELSGGMQKRAGLARAFAMDPDILILDAPTDGLDPIMTRHTNLLIRRVVQQHKVTVLSITTDMPSALEFYDDLAMLYDGRIIWKGTTAAAREAQDPRLSQLLEGRSDGPISMAIRA